MDRIRLRKFASLQYGDPWGFLIELRKVEMVLASSSSTPQQIRTLRTNGLKSEREMREVALFCVGMSERIGAPVRFAPVEDEDYDAVVAWVEGDSQHFCPIQIKELVPEKLNPKVSLSSIIASLSKYTTSQELVVAVHLNRHAELLNPSDLPELPIRELWFFGAVSEDQRKWGLWGNFTDRTRTPVGTLFEYPTST